MGRESGGRSLGRGQPAADACPVRRAAVRGAACQRYTRDRCDGTEGGLDSGSRRAMTPAVAVLQALGAAARRPGSARRGAAAAPHGKVLRYAFRGRRDRLRPGADHATCTRARQRAHLRGAVQLRLPRPAGAHQAAARPTACPRCRPTSRRFTFRIQPGIYFADDPAFEGKARASWSRADYVYSLKRLFDPRWKSPHLLRARERRHRRAGRRCAGDALDGASAVRLRPRGRGPARARPLHAAVPAAEPRPRFVDARWPTPALVGAVAREVVEFYGDKIDGAPGRHRPVPAGAVAPQLADRARAQPELPRGCATTPSRRPTTPTAQAAAERAAGPARCRWSTASRSPSSRRRSRAGSPSSTASIDVLEPAAARVRATRDAERQARAATWRSAASSASATCAPTSTHVVLQHGGPVVGGYTPEKVALRRAIALAYDIEREIRVRPARPGDPGAVADRAARPAATTRRFKQRDERATTRRKAKALLDLYGYVDRDGDGWREQPDGSPLRAASTRPQPDQLNRAAATS